ncbi:GtrA family protein [Saccharothrix sp. BKS2]|uniref:GtrA family protein n=1 Tax=Saccharothrix sp. BKS2 TaxID=3064400 RepID=UPI0039E99894
MNLGRIVRFGAVGVVNTGTYFLCYVGLTTFLPYFAAHVLAFVLSMIGSYFLNCYFTFRVKPSWKSFLLFPLSTLANFVIQSAGLWALVEHAHMNQTVAPLVAAVVAIPITFLVTQLIFRGNVPGDLKKSDSPQEATA